MSGHSKWSTIKRQKAATDQKRGQAFSKLAAGITIAAREGGGDPTSNFKLRLAVEKARAVNMPKDNIERAIAKGTGSGDAGELSEVLYEGFTPVSGVAVLIECVTDKKQRTAPEIKSLVEKGGGIFGSSGSVSYLFDYVGEVVIEKKEKTLDEIFETVVEGGAEDVQDAEEAVIVNCQVGNLQNVLRACEEAGYTIADSGLVYVAKAEIELEDEKRSRVAEFIEKIDSHDDVQNVYVNTQI